MKFGVHLNKYLIIHQLNFGEADFTSLAVTAFFPKKNMKKLIFERGALKILKNGVRNRVQREKTVRHANFQSCNRIFARHFGLQH